MPAKDWLAVGFLKDLKKASRVPPPTVNLSGAFAPQGRTKRQEVPAQPDRRAPADDGIDESRRGRALLGMNRWHRFWHWFFHGSKDNGMATCPNCGEPFKMGPTPTYYGRFAQITIPRTKQEIQGACPTCGYPGQGRDS